MKRPSFLRTSSWQESAYLDADLSIAIRHKGVITFQSTELATDPATSDLSAERTDNATGFIVGSRFCRFLSVPWSDFLLDSTAANAHYRSAFADVYGDVGATTQFAAADEPHGQARVVCALDSSIVDKLLAWSARKGRRVTFVRPAVQVAYEFFRAQMAGATGIFALRESTILSLLCWEDGRVAEVDTFSVSDNDWKTRLDDEVARIRLQTGNTGKLYVADAWNDGVTPQSEDALMLQWPAFSKTSPDPMSRLATCGL